MYQYSQYNFSCQSKCTRKQGRPSMHCSLLDPKHHITLSLFNKSVNFCCKQKTLRTNGHFRHNKNCYCNECSCKECWLLYSNYNLIRAYTVQFSQKQTHSLPANIAWKWMRKSSLKNISRHYRNVHHNIDAQHGKWTLGKLPYVNSLDLDQCAVWSGSTLFDDLSKRAWRYPSGMANSVDPDQTAWMCSWSGFTLFGETRVKIPLVYGKQCRPWSDCLKMQADLGLHSLQMANFLRSIFPCCASIISYIYSS